MSDDKKLNSADNANNDKPQQYFFEGFFDSAYYLPADNVSEHTFKIKASSSPPAFPPQYDHRTKLAAHRYFRSVALTLFVLFLLSTIIFIAYLILNYDLQISRDEATIVFTLKDTRKNNLNFEDVRLTPSPDSNFNIYSAKPAPNSSEDISLGTAIVPETLPNGSQPLSYQQIYKKCVPSVVSISVVSHGSSKAGSGIVLSNDGLIITNNHLIENASSIIVTVDGDYDYEALIVGADSPTDLAVLKINASSLLPAIFGDSDLIEVGDDVLAIGNPLNQTLSMSNGIISAINRRIIYNGYSMTLLQTNAAINEGNSGGPLINRFGQVVGITNMKMVSSFTSVEGMGFAIPMRIAIPIIEQLVRYGYVPGRPSLGLIAEDYPLAYSVLYSIPQGVAVSFVFPDSDAALNGIRKGDIIVEINGSSVKSADALSEVLNSLNVGDSVSLRIFRNRDYFYVNFLVMDAALFHNPIPRG